MANLLYIANIAGKRMSYSFPGSAIEAAHILDLKFYCAANRKIATEDDIRKDEEKYGIKLLNIDVSRSPFSLKNWKAYKQLCHIIRENKIDYIHCNTPTGGMIGRLAGKKCNVKKVIYQVHGFHFFKGAPKKNWLLYYNVEKWLAHYTDALITINQEDYEVGQKLNLCNHGKCYYVPGVGINLSQYVIKDVTEVRKKIRTEIGLKDNDRICISMGYLIPQKNFALAIIAISRILNKYPNLHYLICGKGCDEDNLKTIAKKYNVENNIHFLGYRNDIKDLLRASDVFFFTSFREGLSRAMMEAMASGLPIVCSRIRGNTDLIEEGKGGLMFDPNCIEEATSALDKLLSSEVEMEAMRKYNLKRIQDFSFDKVCKQLVQIYKDEFFENEEAN